MNQNSITDEDTLRPEYDFTKMRLRKKGVGTREVKPLGAQVDPDLTKEFNGIVVAIEPDVAEVFPNSKAIHDALRGLIQSQAKATQRVSP